MFLKLHHSGEMENPYTHGSLRMGIRYFSAPIDNSIHGRNGEARDPSHAPSNSHGQGPSVTHSPRSSDPSALNTSQAFPDPYRIPHYISAAPYATRDPPDQNTRHCQAFAKAKKIPPVRRYRRSSQIQFTFPSPLAVSQPVLTDPWHDPNRTAIIPVAGHAATTFRYFSNLAGESSWSAMMSRRIPTVQL
jgi:hypothetical protein